MRRKKRDDGRKDEGKFTQTGNQLPRLKLPDIPAPKGKPKTSLPLGWVGRQEIEEGALAHLLKVVRSLFSPRLKQKRGREERTDVP